MTSVVLFHHAQGLTEGVVAFADRLRAAGHDVKTPDSYDGHSFATLDEGLAYAGEIGFGTVAGLGVAAVADLPADVVYLGFSLGVMAAQQLTQTRAGARGGVFVASCLPASEFGGWPAGVRAQVHGMDADPIFAEEGDLEAAQELVAAAPEVELFTYPGSAHLFMDSSLPDYDAPSAEQLTSRVLAFLDRVG